MKPPNSLVYSTETGRIKPQTAPPAKPTSDGIIRLFKETKGRGGKCVVVIKGFNENLLQIAELTKQLKQLCGTGGTQKEYQIEIQGDHRDKIKVFLDAKGYKTKLAGG